jgi:hypothetical protein
MFILYFTASEQDLCRKPVKRELAYCTKSRKSAEYLRYYGFRKNTIAPCRQEIV